jgi:quinol monooxygenase YgiN
MKSPVFQSRLVVTLRIKIRPHAVAKMRFVAHDLMTASRTEHGCILYDIVQSRDDETLFFLYMVWRDEESYRRHAASPYVRAFDNEIAREIQEMRFTTEKWCPLG